MPKTPDIKAGIKELRNFHAWNGEPMKTDRNAIQLSAILKGCNSNLERNRKIPFRLISSDPWTVVSDASTDKVCFYRAGLEDHFTVLRLSKQEQTWSSSKRELVAMEKILRLKGKQFSPMAGSRTIFWLTDNQNVERFIKKGSSKPDILSMAMGIWTDARKLRLNIEPIWTCLLYTSDAADE